MKFYLSLIAFLFVSLFLLSGFSPFSSPLAVGDEAPDFTVTSDSSHFSLQSARGSKVLVTFWSVTDASSRCDCNFYSAILADSRIRHVAINLDQNSLLYNEVVKTDSISGPDVYSPSALQAAEIARDYSLNDNFGSVLISENGTVEAFNPSADLLDSKR